MVIASNSTDHPLPKKPLQIKQDDKFYSRLLSKENTNSFRVYYGVASGSVPFLWESQPGTPKKSFNDSTLPPLTPPPSYYLNSKKKPNNKKQHSSSKSKLMPTMFPRLINLKKPHVSSSPPVPSLSSSSSSSLSSFTSSLSSSSGPTTPSYNNVIHRRNRFSSPRSSFDSRVDYEENADFHSPTSILCFGVRRNGAGSTNDDDDDNDRIRGCYSMMIMKRALLSIIGGGHGSGGLSAQGTAASS